MSIDQGTTGTTVLLFDRELNILAKSNHEFPQKFSKPGWVAHDPEEIWKSVEASIADVMSAPLELGYSDADVDISAIGITNQRETTILWDRNTGEPLHDAIVWQCRRTEPICAKLKEQGYEQKFIDKTGLVLDPYFSGTKIKWLLDNVPSIREKTEAGEVAFGTVDSYLIWRLTGGAVHVTDVTNASRTLLMNLETLEWDDELLSILNIPRSILPEIKSCSEIYGTTVAGENIKAGIPVAGIAGDQQAALFGQMCLKPGDVKCTFGTGAFLLMNTGSNPVKSSHGLLTTVGWKIGNETVYALEGSAFIAGAAVQWLRDGLRVIKKAAEIEDLASKVQNSAELVFVPALAGLGSPHWKPNAKGLLCGIDRGTTLEHIARAVLEGIALQNCDLLNAMQNDLGKKLEHIRVDGGASANNLLMQIQSDLLGINLMRPQILETTALGAGILAGLAVGIWETVDEPKAHLKTDKEFHPQISIVDREKLITRWEIAIKKA